MMRAGRKKNKIELYSPVELKDEYGDISIVWEKQIGIWSKATPARGKEYFAQLQTNNKNLMTFTISYRSDISDKWRVLYKNQYYEIHNIINVDEKNTDLELMCSVLT